MLEIRSKYKEPTIQIIEFVLDDIISASGNSYNPNNDDSNIDI